MHNVENGQLVKCKIKSPKHFAACTKSVVL